MEHQDALRKVGVDTVIVYCVNDASVMQAWAKNQKVGLVRYMLDILSFHCWMTKLNPSQRNRLMLLLRIVVLGVVTVYGCLLLSNSSFFSF